MFHSNQNPIEPEYSSVSDRQDGFYETGNTRPPKKHGCALAAVMLLCIFLGGLVGSVILSARLFQAESGGEDRPDDGTSLSGTVPAQQSTTEPETTAPTETTDSQWSVGTTPAAVPNVSQEGGLSYQEIYQKVSPSVVSITVSARNGSAYGSGIILSESGYVITNCHVVENALSITVTLFDERTCEAELVGKDVTSDLAVLQIQADGLVAAEFGDSDAVQVGDAVAAIGDPLGQELRGTMTEGIISAINRNLTIQGRTMTLLQTSAALNEGNSGGPLINCYGQVIGINTAKIGSYYSSDVESLGFAIPVNTAREIIDQLIQVGYVPGRPSLGVETAEMEYQYRLFYNLPEGLYITEVDRDSNAWSIGVEAGDVITQLAGQSITCQKDLNAVLSQYQAGDTVELVIYRRGNYLHGALILEEAGND